MEIEYEVTRTSTTTTREIVMEGGTSTKTVTMSGWGGGAGGSLVMEKVCILGLILFFSVTSAGCSTLRIGSSASVWGKLVDSVVPNLKSNLAHLV